MSTRMGVVLLVCATLGASRVDAQSTPYVRNLDPAYVDLDLLVSEGLVRRIVLGERPYSRAAFARFVDEARTRSRERGTPLTGRPAEALARLEERFGRAPSSAGAEGIRQTGAFLELTGSSSPSRPFRTGADGSIDGDVNPLLRLNQGRVLDPGLTGAVETGFDLQGAGLAGQLRPRAWFGTPEGPDAVDGSVTLLEAYGRGVLGPLALDVGRNHVALGHGTDGGALLSHNARGLDMVRIAMDRPIQLPGPFRALGLWQVSGLLAYMGENRDTPGSFMSVLRLSSRPSRFFELGISYMNIQGGEGSPPGNWRDRLHDTFFFWTDGGSLEISDKIASADLAITVPAIGTNLYANFFTTDDRGRFKQPAGGYWEDAVWLAGVRVRGLGPADRLDVWSEWRHAGPRAHTHGQFTSGVTLDGRVLGDFMGPNAAGVLVGLDWNGPVSRVGVTAAWERYSGDDWTWGLLPGGGPFNYDWWRVADNPDEIRRRVTVDWTHPMGEGLETSLLLGYERVTRFAYTDDPRSNVLAQIRVGYGF